MQSADFEEGAKRTNFKFADIAIVDCFASDLAFSLWKNGSSYDTHTPSLTQSQRKMDFFVLSRVGRSYGFKLHMHIKPL